MDDPGQIFVSKSQITLYIPWRRCIERWHKPI